jgi:RNA polymerase sigma-70 factor (ECF subfamily)
MASEAISYIPSVSLPSSEDSSLGVSSEAVRVSPSQLEVVASPQVGQTDETLLVAIAKGSREALGLLFRRYARAVFVLASRILRDVAEAEDLVQEVFLSLSEKAKLFDPSKGVGASWLMRIAYLRALDRRKYLGVRHH